MVIIVDFNFKQCVEKKLIHLAHFNNKPNRNSLNILSVKD